MNKLNSRVDGVHIAVVGGGVAGATAAIHFSELGFKVTLLEKGPSLVNGPPICHLHAGGNLYREISTEQCIELLKQSIDSVRLFPSSINIRPTVIAIPKTDEGQPEDLLTRLEAIAKTYKALVEQEPRNQVLGHPDHYYKLYTQADLELLTQRVQPTHPSTMDEWVIPFARHANLNQLKYPVVMVQEFGWSVFRLSAIASLALEQFPSTKVLCNTELQSASWDGRQWSLNVSEQESPIFADYLVNACGFETGTVDDRVGVQTQRLVEFKAAYVTRWAQCSEEWPEVIFHGPRGTPQGMAQLTPYADGIFQLHGMTQEITLFEDGLVSSNHQSSQPRLPLQYMKKIQQGWDEDVLNARTQGAIEHMAQFIPDFHAAHAAGKALFGAQQIPGNDVTLRAADVAFSTNNYACIEIVKASSALQAAQKTLEHWFELPISNDIEAQHPVTQSLSADEVEQRAIMLAEMRDYPIALAKTTGEALFRKSASHK
ncbi:FAD-dependent oxidoreductase [Vibrio sp. IRLE0018]|uniref:FAD-dependent oxidoreductase n=1 Tax=Vibrio floridensis TaxID=2908007 RepID=UPI001F2A415A|nr:FAD-dependent oxidoreductase [Vibrio floridensis]MCF8777886.1 FAD-dependent oxidoreductase [Vibrio floridensis]